MNNIIYLNDDNMNVQAIAYQRGEIY